MSSFGEVRSWNAVALTAVADVLVARTATLHGLQDELDSAETSTWWRGETAFAASYSHTGLAERLRRVVAQVAAVRTALDEAGASVQALAESVAVLASFAHGWGFVIGDDGSVRDDRPAAAAPTTQDEQVALAERVRAQEEIVARVAQIMRTAADVDGDLAAVLEAALADDVDDGAGATLAGADAAGVAAGGLSVAGPPESGSPFDNAAWWDSLSPEQQADILAAHPEQVGNLDGVPAVVRDEANRARLPVIEAELQAELTSLDAQLSSTDDPDERQRLVNEIGLVHDRIASAEATRTALRVDDRQLLVLDFSGERAKVAVAVGNVDTADHVAVTTPGVNTTVDRSLVAQVADADVLAQQTADQLVLAGESGTVAVVAWIGYEPPVGDVGKNLGTLTGDSVGSVAEAAVDDRAQAGSTSLASFYNGIDASRATDPHLTALGHSYGSLTTGLALQQGTGVDDAVLYGSPGFGTDAVADLGLGEGRVYLMEAEGDVIADLGAFGGDPTTMPGVTHLETGATTLPDGTPLTGSSGHSEYTDHGDREDGDYRRTTGGYNLANVVGGMPERTVGGVNVDVGDVVRAALQPAVDVGEDALEDVRAGVEAAEELGREVTERVGDGVEVVGEAGSRVVEGVGDGLEVVEEGLGGLVDIVTDPRWPL